MSEPVAIREIPSPVGPLRLAATRRGLARIALPRSGGPGFRGWLERHLPGGENVDWLPALDLATKELDEYFAGKRRAFDLPCDLRGSPFQLAVWAELLTIPYAELRTYGEVARSLGRPSAPRAVGGAVGANPLPIVVPCHRVVAANGRLGGYTGGIQVKRALLAVERGLLADLGPPDSA